MEINAWWTVGGGCTTVVVPANRQYGGILRSLQQCGHIFIYREGRSIVGTKAVWYDTFTACDA